MSDVKSHTNALNGRNFSMRSQTLGALGLEKR
jgi:hypothetical protein